MLFLGKISPGFALRPLMISFPGAFTPFHHTSALPSQTIPSWWVMRWEFGLSQLKKSPFPAKQALSMAIHSLKVGKTFLGSLCTEQKNLRDLVPSGAPSRWERCDRVAELQKCPQWCFPMLPKVPACKIRALRCSHSADLWHSNLYLEQNNLLTSAL